WVRAETFKLQDINYEQAPQNFSKLLKEVEGPVMSQLLKEEVLFLDSEPWSKKRPASKVQPAEDQTIPTEDFSQAEDVAESSQKHIVSEVSQAALDRQTLEELKQNDIRLQQRMDENDQWMKERMDVQDSKIDTVVSMVHQQKETADQIK
ncbi:hypothetical protein VSR34_38595, partial [Paraburkholderia sp. JHI2823]|uniref:hypothetical protein n=1 Tax=Paraburkholderia sp. JHI2823 TaxID=3112960 RepID=UPI00316F9C28